MKIMTEKDAAKAVIWFKEYMGLEDWSFLLFIQDDPPDWVGEKEIDQLGETTTDKRYKLSRIWVSPEESISKGESQLVTLFHEVMHSVAADTGIEDDTDEEKEFLWTRIAMLANDLYSVLSRKKK